MQLKKTFACERETVCDGFVNVSVLLREALKDTEMDREADREWVWEAVGVGRRLPLTEGVTVATEVTVLLNG